MRRAASLIIRGWPFVVGRYPGRSAATSASLGQYQSIVELETSFGTSTRTGPGRPVVAIWNASRTIWGTSWAFVTSQLCFVTLMVIPVVSHSWKASLPIEVIGTWPVTTTSGIESM